MNYTELDIDGLNKKRNSLVKAKGKVDEILKTHRFNDFNVSFYANPNNRTVAYHESTDAEETYFSKFAREVVNIVSRVVEFWSSDENPAYRTLSQWCRHECSSYQEQLFYALDDLNRDLKFIEYLIAENA